MSRLYNVVHSKLKLLKTLSPQTVHRFYCITAATINEQKETLKVNLDNGRNYEYPWVYLQDNCTCETCFHSSSQSRLRKLPELDLDKKISNVSVAGNGSSVKCTWTDGHESLFSEKWLIDRRFTKDNVSSRRLGPRDNPTLAGADLKFPRDTFDAVMTDEKRLLSMLQKFCNIGVFILEGAPLSVGQLRKLAQKIGFIRVTHYGEEFTVKSEPNAVNLAYTAARLGLHTDLPYYVYPPGVQLLHCIRQYQEGIGGESHLVDGFLVADQLKKEHPEHYETLCTVPLEFYDVGKDYIDFFKYHHSPSFIRNPENGSMVRIVYSNQVLSSYMPIKMEDVKPVYKALKTFTEYCYKKENLIAFKMQEGEVLFFDNWRYLHGREGYDPSKGHRHLEGCYFDWDEVFSRINVLKQSVSS